MKIAVIGAMKSEIEEIEKSLISSSQDYAGAFEVRVGQYKNHTVILCRCGIGKVHSAAATSAILTKFDGVNLVINVGVAGGVGKGIKQGDLVVGEKTVQHDYDSTPDGLKKGQVPGFVSEFFDADEPSIKRILNALNKKGYPHHYGVIATGDQFINSKTKVEQLREEFGALACDMESGAIAQVCAVYNVPFFSIRAISDGGDDTAITDFYEFVTVAAKHCASVILDIL